MVGVDVDKFCETMDFHIAKTERSGGTISLQSQFDLLMNRANPLFYKDTIKAFRKKQQDKKDKWQLTDTVLQDLKDSLLFDYENTPKEVRLEYEPKKEKPFAANNVDGRKRRSPIPESEQCAYCKKHRQEKAKSHRKEKCWYGDQPGYVKLSANKAGNFYSSFQVSTSKDHEVYLDTGCANGSFTKDRPKINFSAATGRVQTANNSFAPILGKGKIKFGDVLVDTNWVPSFEKNLINDADILKQNKFIVITKNRFAILGPEAHIKVDPETVVASGTRKADDLLSFDKITDKTAVCNFGFAGNLVNESENADLIHRSLGHAGVAWINRTIENDAAGGLPSKAMSLTQLCEICETTKGRQGNIAKSSNTKFAPGEAVAMDSQGPFRTVAYDATTSNMKIVDHSSGYIAYSSVRSVNSQNALSLFNSFRTKLERRTGNKVKYLYCDDGNEFKKEFLNELNRLGIVKRKGLPYDHHNPGKAERAHQTIMQLGRAMHKESKLPLKFYPLSHAAAVYISNRLVHSDCKKTPYELINGTKPDLAHLFPYGSVCYATIPPEKRGGKLLDTGFKGRLVGYGDDDGLEEVKGYHIIRESDQSLHWIGRRNVKFDMDAKITNLPDAVDVEETDLVDAEDVFSDAEDVFSDPTYLQETEYPSGTTIIHEEQIETEYPNTRSRSRREAMTSSEIQENILTEDAEGEVEDLEDLEAESEDFVDDDILQSSHYSWFNPHAPNYKFRVNFARSAAKIGVSPSLMFAVFAAIQEGVAVTYEDAMKSKEKVLYQEAMKKEYEGMLSQSVYELAKLPKDRKSVKGKWVFRKKFEMFGKLIKIKARWVAKGFTQVHGQDYFETFAAVAKLKSVRVYLAIASALKLDVFQHDVPQAFLGTGLEEEIWMDQIQGFEDGTNRKCLLKKTIYGLKQSSREFNKSVDSFLKEVGFRQSTQDSCVYSKREGKKLILFLLYVDDCLVAGNDSEFTSNFQDSYKNRFNILEPTVPANWFIGLHIQRNEKGEYSVNQNQYVKEKLVAFESVVGAGKVSRVLPEIFFRNSERS